MVEMVHLDDNVVHNNFDFHDDNLNDDYTPNDDDNVDHDNFDCKDDTPNGDDNVDHNDNREHDDYVQTNPQSRLTSVFKDNNVFDDNFSTNARCPQSGPGSIGN